MGRTRNPNRDKAEEIYLKSKGSILLKDIAEQLGLPEGTVRGWKNKDKWEQKLNGTFQKESKKKTERSKTKKYMSKAKKNKIVEKLEEAELTEMQRLFCLYYIKTFNATMAAIKAGYAKGSAHVTGSQLLRNPKVAAEIRRLKGAMQEEIFIDAMDVLNKYIKIAFADITDYVKFGQREIQVMGPFGPVYKGEGKNKKPVTKIVNYIDLKESDLLDGSIITEAKQGKDGVSIKLADKMKALEKLEKYFDLIPDTWQRKIEEEKLALQRQKLEGESEEVEDDGFIAALEGKVSEVWGNAEED